MDGMLDLRRTLERIADTLESTQKSLEQNRQDQQERIAASLERIANALENQEQKQLPTLEEAVQAHTASAMLRHSGD